MEYERFELVVDNFDNSAMVDSPNNAVSGMLRDIADRIDEYGMANQDGLYLKDVNGNRVGLVSVSFE